MEYEADSNRMTQITALLMTVAVVGGAIFWAMTAA